MIGGNDMFRKIFATLVLTLLFTLTASNVDAEGTFQQVYNAENFSAELKADQAIEESFNTPDGKLSFQLRKLANSSADKRMHVIALLDDKKIYDEHFPDAYPAYSFRVIKNVADSRLFYVIESGERALLLGYLSANGKMAVYIDSQNYYHKDKTAPTIVVTRNGDLVMAFENFNLNTSARYLFTWDAGNQWFAYSDLGTYNRLIARDRQN